jgi:hypothetical protein
MDTSDTALKIQTLGSFNISANGKPVATEWPTDTGKVLFCSLLSPLDLLYSWDRICRTLWDEPATRSSIRRMEKTIIRPLDNFLTSQMGFSPLIAEHEGIRFDHQHVQVDALQFHGAVVDGLKLLISGNDNAALKKFNRAHSLFKGSFLPGVAGKIIEHTRNDLDSMYKSIVMGVIPLTQKPDYSDRNQRTVPGLHVTASKRPVESMDYGHEESVYHGYRANQ